MFVYGEYTYSSGVFATLRNAGHHQSSLESMPRCGRLSALPHPDSEAKWPIFHGSASPKMCRTGLVATLYPHPMPRPKKSTIGTEPATQSGPAGLLCIGGAVAESASVTRSRVIPNKNNPQPAESPTASDAAIHSVPGDHRHLPQLTPVDLTLGRAGRAMLPGVGQVTALVSGGPRPHTDRDHEYTWASQSSDCRPLGGR
jgi:hypothetical protein